MIKYYSTENKYKIKNVINIIYPWKCTINILILYLHYIVNVKCVFLNLQSKI